jgi:methionyl-tRNA formyltransferase
MNIVFMGSPEFAVPALDALNDSHHSIISVISGKDKRRGRNSKPVPTAVKKKALDLGLKTYDTDTLKSDDVFDYLNELKPDLIVVVAFKILPGRLLEIPTHGAVNIHASLLPEYRGAAPIHWAVINGAKETGITIFKLDLGIDTGNIILRKSISIGQNETTGSVYSRLMNLGAESIVPAVDILEEGSAEFLSQNDEDATGAPKLFSENTRINFEKPAEEIHNFVRGLNPFPSAWTELNGQKFTIHETRLAEEILEFPDHPLKAGELYLQSDNAWVGTGTDPLLLKTVQIQGKQRTDGDAFLRGWRGDHFCE